MNRRIKDLSGQKFGKINVVTFSRMEDRISYWNVYCDCNPKKTLEFSWHQIKWRKLPNCGCENSSWNRNNTYDLNGEHGILHIDKTLVFFDLEDYNLLKNTSWCVTKTKGYIVGKINNKSLRMHRLITNAPKGKIVDHINGNKCDNRKHNLRITTAIQNARNRKNKIKGCSSKFFGIHKVGKRWVAQIKNNGENFYLGTFDNEISAAKAYNEKAEEFGFLTRNDV